MIPRTPFRKKTANDKIHQNACRILRKIPKMTLSGPFQSKNPVEPNSHYKFLATPLGSSHNETTTWQNHHVTGEDTVEQVGTARGPLVSQYLVGRRGVWRGVEPGSGFVGRRNISDSGAFGLSSSSVGRPSPFGMKPMWRAWRRKLAFDR